MDETALEPWELTEKEWKRERESCKAQGQFTYTSGSKSQAVARINKLEWLIYGIKKDSPVTWHDVIGKAFEEGKLAKCPNVSNACLGETKTPLPEGWSWDDSEEKHYAWCPHCVKAWGWK